MKKYFYHFCKFLLIFSWLQGAYTSEVKAQYLTILEDEWEGDWESIEGFVYDLKMKITATSKTHFEGAIEWTVVNYPASRRDFYGTRGKKAIEYIKGTAQGLEIYLKGYAKKDPHNIIALDEYRLVLDCEKPSLTGITKHHGTWKATFFAVKMLESIEAADSLIYNVHYCNTLALNDATYQNPQARAIYYEWARNFVKYKQFNTHYFHLPEWSFTYQNQSATVKAAEMGNLSPQAKPAQDLLKDDKALTEFEEQLNQQVFRKRMEVALALTSKEMVTFDKTSEEGKWIAAEQQATQKFLNQNTYFQINQASLNERITFIKQTHKNFDFWAVLPKETINNFDDKVARINWQQQYLRALKK